jgi:hypothetical protein
MRGWRKLRLLAPSEGLFGFEGDWLYLDLDVVVTGPLDEFFTYKPEQPFVVMQNWTQPGSGIGNTSVQRFRVGHEAYLLRHLLEHQDEVFRKFTNSQTYVSRTIKDLEFWPDAWCVLFKVHCVPGWPARFWKAPTLPATARVVAFPGTPNPHQALRGEWPEPKLRKKLYKFIRPAEWIGEHWR